MHSRDDGGRTWRCLLRRRKILLYFNNTVIPLHNSTSLCNFAVRLGQYIEMSTGTGAMLCRYARVYKYLLHRNGCDLIQTSVFIFAEINRFPLIHLYILILLLRAYVWPKSPMVLPVFTKNLSWFYI